MIKIIQNKNKILIFTLIKSLEIKQISHSIKLTNYILLFTVIDQFILNEIGMTFALKYSWFDFSHAPNIINLLAIEVRQS